MEEGWGGGRGGGHPIPHNASFVEPLCFKIHISNAAVHAVHCPAGDGRQAVLMHGGVPTLLLVLQHQDGNLPAAQPTLACLRNLAQQRTFTCIAKSRNFTAQ